MENTISDNSGDRFQVELYHRRWYILTLFSLFSLFQCAVWNTWGPIAETAKNVYGWDDGDLTLFTLWGVVVFPVFAGPFAWLLGRSLRWAVAIAALLVVIGTFIRCIPILLPEQVVNFDIYCNIGAIFNAMAGPVAMAAPIQLSANWFPPGERVAATGVGQMFNALGIGVSFIFGTFLVREASDDCELVPPSSSDVLCLNKESDLKLAKDDIDILLWVHGGASLVIFLLILLYFPSQPPKPPSISATAPRTLFLEGFKTLLKSRTAWFTMITYSMSQGLVQMWQSVMIINILNLEIEGVTEKWASMLGIVISFVAVAASIGFAFILKWFRKRMKHVIILLLAVSGTIFIMVALLFQGVIQFQNAEHFKISAYILLLSGISLACASAPVLFEFSVELSYPVAEGCIGTWLTVWFNILSVLFFLVFQIPDIGTDWLNYVLPGSVLLPLPVLLMVKENYRRLKIDEGEEKR